MTSAEKFQACLQTCLGDAAADISLDTPIKALDLDSLDFTELMMELEDTFETEIEAHLIDLDQGLVQILQMLSANDATAPDTTAPDTTIVRVQQIKAGAGHLSVVIMPGLGGQPHYAKHLTQAFAPTTGVLQVSARDEAEDFFRDRSVQDMAQDYAAALAPSLDTPVMVMGFSFGAYLAHETAIALAARGHRIDAVVILDAAVPWPHNGPTGPLKARAFRRKKIAELQDFARQIEGFDAGNFFIVPDFGTVRVGDFPKDLRGVVRHCYSATAAYKPTRSDLPMLVFQGEHRQVADADCGPYLGWDRFTTGPIQSPILGTEHTSIPLDPHAAAQAARQIETFTPHAAQTAQAV